MSKLEAWVNVRQKNDTADIFGNFLSNLMTFKYYITISHSNDKPHTKCLENVCIGFVLLIIPKKLYVAVSKRLFPLLKETHRCLVLEFQRLCRVADDNR